MKQLVSVTNSVWVLAGGRVADRAWVRVWDRMYWRTLP